MNDIAPTITQVPEHLLQLLEGQLWTLLCLESVVTNNPLGEFAKQACEHALVTASVTVDRLLADHPALGDVAKAIVERLSAEAGAANGI